ncbi:glycosyltransferase family 4 protein [Acinetobacter ursingii]|uniref:glycosyltransferase family 4 protein n=1 Tax=Acinetobacter ursingii TaxID=108980 RepID=UPI003AF425C2
MIIYDGIIESLQSMGGISVLFKEILLRSDSSKFYYFNYNSHSNLVNSPNLFKLKARYLERYRDFFYPVDESDIFHSTYYRLPKKKCNVITTVHDFTYEKFIKGLPRTVHSWQKKRAILNSDHIICVSRNTANDLMEFCNVDEHKISVVYNGVSPDYYCLDSIQKENQVLFVGGRDGYKNFRYAVQAVAKCKNLSLGIVGSPLNVDEIEFLDNLLPNRYHGYGYLTNEMLNIEYNKSFALLYPSSYEGFGIPPLEAMKAGCPVIAINVSSIPEVVGDAGILLDSIQVDEIIEALQQVDNMRSDLTARGFIQAAKFSWDKCYNETQNVYKNFF